MGDKWKLGVYVDNDNLNSPELRIHYETLMKYCQTVGNVLVANTYFCFDPEKMETDPDYRAGQEAFTRAVRNAGFRVSTKPIRRYHEPDGSVRIKGDIDMNLAIDAMTQSANLEKLIICSGDGDFVALIEAIRSVGRPVEVIGLRDVSRALYDSADAYTSGFLVPGLVQTGTDSTFGYPVKFLRERGFGFMRCNRWIPVESGYGLEMCDAFFHVNDFSKGCDEGALESLQGLYDFNIERSDEPIRETAGDVPIETFNNRVRAKNIRMRYPKFLR